MKTTSGGYTLSGQANKHREDKKKTTLKKKHFILNEYKISEVITASISWQIRSNVITHFYKTDS